MNVPIFTTPAVQLSTLSPGDFFLFADTNNPESGIETLHLTNQGGGTYCRIRDGAIGTLSGEVWVVPIDGVQ